MKLRYVQQQILVKFSKAFGALFTLILAMVAVMSLVPSNVISVQSNILYVYLESPTANTSLVVNNLLTVKIVTYSSADKTNGSATGSVTFPSDILQVINTDSGGTEYQNLAVTIGNGNVSFNASRNPSPVGVAKMFLITFKMIKPGNASVGFSQNSIVDSSTTAYLPAILNITSPGTTSSANSSPSSSSSSGTASSTSTQSTIQNNSTSPKILGSQSNIANIPLADTSVLNDYVAPTPDTTGLIDSVTVDPQYSTSNITWKVNANDVSTRIDYDTSSIRLDKSAPISRKADGTYTSTVALLSPGLRYYYNITASGGGRSDSKYSGVFITRGYPVTFAVTENNSPVEGAQIKIGNQTYVVGSNGKKTIGLAAGRYSITVTTKSASQTKDIYVEEKPIPADGSAPENQAFSVGLSSSLLDGGPGSRQSIISFIGILVGGAIVLGIGFALFIARRRRKFESEASTYSGSGSNVVIDDGYSWRKNDKP